MKSLIIAIVISMAFIPARAQFFKKLKDETTQKLKEKLEYKKSQKIDEKTEQASTKVMSVPDSLVQKTGRAMKKKDRSTSPAPSTDSTAPAAPPVDSTMAKIPSDSTIIQPPAKSGN
jgi:hypothetical protein